MAILEDNEDRIAGMRDCLARLTPNLKVIFFENAAEMIDWLGGCLGSVVLLSLDHDLPARNRDGRSIDCGTGRQVVDYLATLPPTCPVIVHSSNEHCAAGMFFALLDSGWPCVRVYPCDDTAWIAGAWAQEVKRCLGETTE